MPELLLKTSFKELVKLYDFPAPITIMLKLFFEFCEIISFTLSTTFSKSSIYSIFSLLIKVFTFKSGKKLNTSFLFESNLITKTGKVKLLGENLQFAQRKNSFTLTCSVKDKKLVMEALTYNYNAKDASTGKSKRIYGTVKNK